MVMTLGHDESTQGYSPLRHYLSVAEDIKSGNADRIAASNLLLAIERRDVLPKQIGVKLKFIERAAGRKLYAPICR